MSADAVNMDVPTPLGAERPSVLEIDVVDFARHILYESDLHYGLSVGRVATLLGYDGNPSFKVEMPFRHEHNGDKQVYKPADLDLTYSPDDHLSGFTGLIVGATNIDVVTRVKLVEEIVSVASTTRFEPELTEAAMSARHARHLVMEQIDGMLAVAEFRRRSQQLAPTAERTKDLIDVKHQLDEKWQKPSASRTVAAIGAVMAGAALLLAVKKRRD